MPFLTLSALLPGDEDVKMSDVPLSPSQLPAVDMPLAFDSDFELEGPNLALDLNPDFSVDDEDLELRSPRTPTYGGDTIEDTDSQSPIDPEKFFKFPLVSPSQEQSPLTSLCYSPTVISHHTSHASLTESKENLVLLPPLPKIPLLWIWTCHLCRSRWPLGATRRCLIDGHYYCSGDSSTTTQRNVKKKKKGQACSSEFDYIGWQDWTSWKRDVIATKKQALAGSGRASSKARLCLRGCEGCQYPSQCRYERMNQIPEVVAAVSKQSNQAESSKVKTKTKTADTTAKAKRDSNAEQKRNLNVDTAFSPNRKSRSRSNTSATSKQGTTPVAVHGLTPVSEDAGEPKMTHIEETKRHAKGENPMSPGPIDFSRITTNFTQSDRIPTEKRANLEGEVTVMLVDDNRSITPDSGCVTTTEVPDDKAAALTGLSKLTRTRSRKKDRSAEGTGGKQKRISDFLGIAK